LLTIFLLGDGGAVRAVRAAAASVSPCSSVFALVMVLVLISRMSDGASLISSRALLALRGLARLVSFVEEPGPKLDIDVSRFEVG
jgi:hypothetical protein